MKKISQILSENEKEFWEKFRAYIEANKQDEIDIFLHSSQTNLIKEVIKEIERTKRESWQYAGGGGFDTETWCLSGRCIEFPGLKQIAFYGIRNEKWWAKYLFRQQVIKPETLEVKGYNQALQKIIDYIKEGIKI